MLQDEEFEVARWVRGAKRFAAHTLVWREGL